MNCLTEMATISASATSNIQIQPCDIFRCGSGTPIKSFLPPPTPRTLPMMKRLVIEAKADNPKIRNRRMRKKFNGTATKPRLSVFCSDKQLYAMLVDDQNKKCLFYGNTLQKSIRTDSSCTTAEAAERVGEELIRACIELNISEISSYDRNGLARGDRLQAFENPIARHGFLPRARSIGAILPIDERKFVVFLVPEVAK